MSTGSRLLALLAVAAVGLPFVLDRLPAYPTPAPSPVPGPAPVAPEPKKPILPRPRPWENGSASVEAKVGGNVSPDGTEIHCDLPGDLHRRNTTSRGQGCCVWTSIHHSALWQNVPELQEFPKWIQSKGWAGGSYPSYVAKAIATRCRELGVPEPAYLQIENSKDLEPLRLACASGRFVAITYSRSPTGRYGGGRISHMVSLPHADERQLAVLDNNYTGATAYEWMTPDEFLRVCNPGGYWAVILLAPSPPPPPRSL